MLDVPLSSVTFESRAAVAGSNIRGMFKIFVTSKWIDILSCVSKGIFYWEISLYS